MTTLILLLAALLSIVIGAMVVVGQPRRLVSWVFLLFSITIATWSGFVGIFLALHSEAQLYSVATIFYSAAALIAPVMLVILMLLANVRGVMKYVIALSIAFVFIVILNVFPGLLINHIVVGQPNIVDINIPFYLVYTLYFVTYFMLTMLVAFLSMRKGKEGSWKRIKVITYAYGISGTIGMIFNLFLPAIGNYNLIWAGPLCLFVFLPMVYMAIRRYGLFELRIGMVSAVSYAISLVVLIFMYFGLAYSALKLFDSGALGSSIDMPLVNIVIALLLALVFQPVKVFFDHIMIKTFVFGEYDFNNLVTDIGDIATSVDDVNDLLDSVSEVIKKALRAESVHFALLPKNADTSNGVVDKRARLEEAHGIFPVIAGLNFSDLSVFNVEDGYFTMRHHSKTVATLYDKGVSLIVELSTRWNLIGYLIVGRRIAGTYTDRDVKTLNSLAGELVIAIQNTISLQEVRDLNDGLRDRVATATRELRHTNNELKALDRTKDEFISMASHQLRTPLTSVKGYISMVLDGDAGKITDPQRQLLEEAFTSSERMVHLIGDFLNVSRLQNGKFMIDVHECDLAKVVGQEVEGMLPVAKAHGMRVVFKSPKSFPILYIDENKIRQVIMNFMDNAVYYSPNTDQIKVSLTIEDGDAVFRVIDKGMGVPKDAQKQLFGRFFRADNARTQRPDGTGIGLYLGRKVIDGHNGKLVFSSEPGKGSTFGFRLPIKRLSTPPIVPDESESST
ncbi:MAG: ATP-binding protein [Candidatus Saccharimonas sp.]